MAAIVAAYFSVRDWVGSRAPCRERSWTKVTVQPDGMAGLISDGTLNTGEYWPHRCGVMAVKPPPLVADVTRLDDGQRIVVLSRQEGNTYENETTT